MKQFLVCAAALLLSVSAVQAADIKPLDLGKTAQVWLSEDHAVPMVALNITLPAGSGYDPAAKPGLAGFAADLIDEGAGGLNAAAFHAALADRGIQFSATVERDGLVVSIVTLSENLPQALHLLQLALTRPRFDADAVSRVRTQIIQGIQLQASRPPDVASTAFMKMFFNGHVYGHPADGEIAALSGITVEDLRAFTRTHWVRGGIKIAIAGDITAPAATKILADTFKPVSGFTPPPLPMVGRLGAPGVHVIPMAVPQPTILFGLPGIMRGDPDFLPGFIANYILGGGGFSSRLTEEVRVKRGLTYGIETDLTNYHRASVWAGSVATRADAVRPTIAVVQQTMADFAKNGPTQAELDDAKTYLTGSFPIAFASDAGTAEELGAFQREGVDIGYVARRNNLIQAVTLDDVKRVAKRLFNPARLTVVVAGTPANSNSVPAANAPPVRPTPPPVAPPPQAVPSSTAKPVVKPTAKPALKPVIKPRP
jgi:zinc protease